MNPTMKNTENSRLERFKIRMSLSLDVVEVGQAGLEPATSASSVPRSPN